MKKGLRNDEVKRGSGSKSADAIARGLRRHVLPVRVPRDRGCRTVAPSA
ncbi:hypothetical protein [Paenibacillus sp. UNC451MF]|nr:hypothetical protein [Paenibacillus sp. UNC451MF]